MKLKFNLINFVINTYCMCSKGALSIPIIDFLPLCFQKIIEASIKLVKRMNAEAISVKTAKKIPISKQKS